MTRTILRVILQSDLRVRPRRSWIQTHRPDYRCPDLDCDVYDRFGKGSSRNLVNVDIPPGDSSRWLDLFRAEDRHDVRLVRWADRPISNSNLGAFRGRGISSIP